ncbi:group I truncated hemoglobin [Salinithrix halophila]|uniref:Group 1 truncated hemoglobin n=1 Tax=Salinithrix halophila TaxID=1485204 RepID=A0ABV8JGH5_9BACL
MAKPTLYDQLGEEGIIAVVNEFYDRMIMDKRVSHYFIHADTDRLREHQIQYFISHVLGGPRQYDGINLRTAHNGLNITNEAYEVAIKHMNASLRKFNVSPDIQVKVEAFLRGIKPHIIKK